MPNISFPRDVREYLFPHLARAPEEGYVQGRGISGGAVAGYAFSGNGERRADEVKRKVIFFQRVRDPHEVETIYRSAGYVNMTSMGPGAHPILLSRIRGIPVILGAQGEFREGEAITVDGISGRIYRQLLAIHEPHDFPPELERLIAEHDHRKPEVRSLMVLPDDPTPFSRFNAEGIGPFATEYMFFENGQLEAFQRFIITRDETSRELIKGYQRESFKKLFVMAQGKPVAIRYFDPPLHEFLPTNPVAIAELAASLQIDTGELTARIEKLQEVNPAFGYRGCRLGIVESDIYQMQTETIFEAVAESKAEGHPVNIELIYPLIIDHREIDYLNEQVLYPIARSHPTVSYKLGIMVELPSACLDGVEIGKRVQTVSFGTNDLTQTTLGLSRDDAERFLAEYVRKGLFQENPFLRLHPRVADLVEIFVNSARNVNSELEVGICGAHASDLGSLQLLGSRGIKLDYVSVMPYSVVQTKLITRQM